MFKWIKKLKPSEHVAMLVVAVVEKFREKYEIQIVTRIEGNSVRNTVKIVPVESLLGTVTRLNTDLDNACVVD